VVDFPVHLFLTLGPGAVRLSGFVEIATVGERGAGREGGRAKSGKDNKGERRFHG